MRYHDILSFGVAPDETYLAYKDIQRVIDLQEGRLGWQKRKKGWSFFKTFS